MVTSPSEKPDQVQLTYGVFAPHSRVPDVFRLSLRLFLRRAFGAAQRTRRTDGKGTRAALKLH
jgi:hypothetical protein